MRELGFRGLSFSGDFAPVSFSRSDCAVFQRYPHKVPFKDEFVAVEDRQIFLSIWQRLRGLASDLASAAKLVPDFPSMKGVPSSYHANGRSQTDIWCCAFPSVVPNKSYALQVAFIISAQGAELCVCLGAGMSMIKEPLHRAEAEEAWRELQSRLVSVPADVAQAVERSLPSSAALRTSWREPGDSQFGSVKEWASYAGGPDGAQASISVFLSAAQLVNLGDGIGDVLLEMAQDAAPLFQHCYPAATPGIEGLTPRELCTLCRHPRTLHDNGTTPCKAPGCKAGPDGAPCPGFHAEGQEAATVMPSAEFDAESLHELAAADPYNLELDASVYRAVISALRSRKHVILTGPPGTAKTTLAEVVGRLAHEAGWCSGAVLTTATSDWTTYDTIGGLRPAGSGTSLEFHDGLILEAIRKDQWVIIDELNRSNFDRAFGQLFTVLSGQPVVLPWESKDAKRIVLCPAEETRYPASDYERVPIPGSWRIVATMNVFDKSLLFEMSFALMRRFAFIEVPSPEPAVFEILWNRELRDIAAEHSATIIQTLRDLLTLALVKDIGPAVFIDMARFAREYMRHAEVTADRLAFQLFYSYLLPQYEGITEQQGRELFEQVDALTQRRHTRQLTRTLTEVLGITFLSAQPEDGDDG